VGLAWLWLDRRSDSEWSSRAKFSELFARAQDEREEQSTAATTSTTSTIKLVLIIRWLILLFSVSNSSSPPSLVKLNFVLYVMSLVSQTAKSNAKKCIKKLRQGHADTMESEMAY